MSHYIGATVFFMKKILLLAAIVVVSAACFNAKLSAQGCVAIRSTGGAVDMHHNSDSAAWLLNVNNRYYRSYKHFVGTVEQKQRQTLGNEVINHGYTMDLALTRVIDSRWSLGMDVPIESNARSSMYEHGNQRHDTHSYGIGDVRFSAYRWMFDPKKSFKGNLQLGLGIKLPTGDYKYQDRFRLTDSTSVYGPVDQSIQLGDGGTGFTLEINGYYNFTRVIGVYGNLYYLSNPREQNGVSTGRGLPVSPASIKIGSDVMSVPDQYMFRAGVNVNLNNFSAFAGIRKECIPVRDLIGGSQGFRRPGYIISAEPGVTYKIKNVSIYFYAPIALKRNRTQSVPDQNKTAQTGVYTQGDAAFADYATNLGISFKF